MTELFLEFRTESGEEKRVAVSGYKCIIGRHSDSDVAIADGRVSRCHLKIDRVEDIFVVSDAGSSNGSKLNGRPLNDPIALKKGDVLDLGGLKINIALETSDPEPDLYADPVSGPEAETPRADAGPAINVGSQAPAAGGSGSMLLWVMIPVFGIVFLIFAGIILYVIFSGPTTTIAKKQTDTSYTGDDPEPGNDNKSSSNKSGSETSNSGSTSSSPGPNTSSNSDTPTSSGTPPTNNSETAKIEQNGGTFLRNIAQNNPNAFLTTEQATKLSSKIKQFSSNSGVAANLAAAKKSAAEIKSLAQAKNLKPQFLAVAAIAKLGSSKGDVLQTAKGMADVLYKLGVSVSSERADDALLVIAIYEQGAAGDFLKMRNMLQDLANKSPESSRAIRTIWFLQKNGKISQAEYENALNFLAIGTIAQNPKDFGVNADPLGF
jgi:hypothetical protein